MKRWQVLAGLAAAVFPLSAAVGDSERGRQVFDSLQCARCHSVAGIGNKSGPDLAKEPRGNTPAALAAAMWNHAPLMWAAMEKDGVAKGKLSTEDAADLFAWFQAGRYFDKPGSAEQGKNLFTAKGCAVCHTFASPSGSGVPPEGWNAINDVTELARQMWNHAPKMQAALKSRGTPLPQLTAAEMNDIVTYLDSITKEKSPPKVSLASAETGQTLLRAKGCNSCHKGAQALPGATTYTAAAEIAAAMWNHAAQMKQQTALRPEEMRRIAGYLWSRQFENEKGDSKRGEQLFTQKQCAGCHGSSAPYLAHGEESSSYGMVSVLWQHGPAMLGQMKAKNVAWPRFTAEEITDVVAYMKAAK